MKIPSSALPWIISAATAFFAGVLVFGLYQGTLLVPAKGFQTTLQRDSNPLGFYVLAAILAVGLGLGLLQLDVGALVGFDFLHQ